VPGDVPQLPRRGPAPAVDRMSNAELARMVEAEHPYRGKALFELSDRIAHDDDAAPRSRCSPGSPRCLFDRVSLAWSGIIALLAAETAHSRACAYEAFGALDQAEQRDMLDYLEVSAIEEAHPRIA
jgi:hypothetical protein